MITVWLRRPPNQSLPKGAQRARKLTAEAEVVSRSAQENEFIEATRRQCETEVRIVR